MEIEKYNLPSTILFFSVVCIFMILGQSYGWRAVGIIQLIISLKSLKDKKIGVGWQGFKPSTYITGNKAKAIGFVSIIISLILIFIPEHTVMAI